MSELDIISADPTGPDATALLAEIAAEMAALYDGDGVWGFAADHLKQARAAFVVAYLDDAPVGCGGLMPVSDTVAEVKRVYVRPTARGHSLSRRLMAALEARARELGYTTIRLETGRKQPAAIHVYESMGYAHTPCWDDYSDDPESVCYQKLLV